MNAVWNFNAGKGEEGTIKTMKSFLSLSLCTCHFSKCKAENSYIRTRSQRLISDV